MTSRFIDDALNESQTITYRQLSRGFGLHVNAAKEILWQHLQQNQDQVSATYVITGWKQVKVPEVQSTSVSDLEPSHDDVQELRTIQFAKDNELDQQIEAFAKVSTIHVYSLGPKNGASNEAALEFSSQSVSKSNMRSSLSDLSKLGVIVNKHLPDRMISSRQDGRKVAATTTKATIDKPTVNVKTETKKPNTIASAFKNTAKRETVRKPEEKNATASTVKTETKKKSAGASKVDAGKKADAEKLKKEEEERLRAQEKDLEDLFSDEGSDMDVDEKLQREEEEKAKLDLEAEKEPSPVDDVEMKDAPDEEQADEENIPPEPVKGKKKIKKSVTTKTADGFLQTEMVDVWVSDDEAPAPAPKPAAKPKAMAVKSEKGAKKGAAGQKSLMSFFGKKK